MKGTAVAAVMGVIVTLIIIFNIVGNTGSDIISAGRAVTDANNCSEGTDAAGVTLGYNVSNGQCYNSTTGLYTAGQYDLPFNTLFSGTGILILILMAGILIGGVVYVRSKMKQL